MWYRPALLALLVWLGAWPLVGTAAAEPGLPDSAAADTVRSNLWLAEAMLADIAAEIVGRIGDAPARVLLKSESDVEGAELLQSALHGALAARGHEVFLIDEDVPATPDVTHILGFRMLGVSLEYPEVGRTLGLWRNWIGRKLTVSVLANLSESPSGRLVFYRKVERIYQDRFPDGMLADVQSGTYGFTVAEPARGAWHDRVEEVVVLGTLAGLVAVFFANTSN